MNVSVRVTALVLCAISFHAGSLGCDDSPSAPDGGPADSGLRDSAAPDADAAVPPPGDSGSPSADAARPDADADAGIGDGGGSAGDAGPVGPIMFGDPSFNASGGINEGDLLVLRTDGTRPFGDDGPTLAARITLAGQADGDDIDLAQIEGSASYAHDTSGRRLTIGSDADLPYGRGLRIGANGSAQNDTTTGRLRVVTALSTEIYEAVTIYWPDAHQTAALPALDATATWQIKSIWHFYQADGHGAAGKSDYFAGLPAWYNPGGYWADGRVIASNSGPTSTFVGGPTGVLDPGRFLPVGSTRKTWRNTPMYRQFWARHAPVSTSAAGSDGMVRLTDSSAGLVIDRRFTDSGQWNEAGAGTIGVDRFTLPGFVRGYNIPLGRHVLFGDVYVTHSMGPGAAARVEVGDAPLYDDCLALSPFNVELWTDAEVRVRIRKGAFHGRSLSGLHLFVTTADNVTRHAGVIP